MNQHSISGEDEKIPPKAQDKSPKTARGAKTKAKLLDAACREFGARGFHDCMIVDITQSAGVGLGTFYVYFESKEEIFRELVSYMGHLTRAYIAQRLEGIKNRLEAEKIGLKAFIEFARGHKDLYRIVMESQFVVPDAYHQYYENFHSAYETNLKGAVAKQEISKGNDEVRAWSLIGLSVFLGMRYGVWDDSKDLDDVCEAAFDLIKNGLKTSGAA